jgi:hypothetical protein
MRRLLILLFLSSLQSLHADGIISTYAGARAINNVLASATVLGNPKGMAIDEVGNIFLADSGNNLIRRIDGATGLISTIAGTGIAGYSGDNGPALDAQINAPTQLALYQQSGFGSASLLYITDTGNNRIRCLNLETGEITTVAGNGLTGTAGDLGPAIYASFSGPQGVAVSASNSSIYICDTNNSKIRQVDLSTGIISTIAGTGSAGFSGDGGAGTLAQIDRPINGYFGPSGDYYFTDSQNLRVRRINTSNDISTVAGSGVYGNTGDGGAATLASFRQPQGIYVDVSENVFVTDSSNFNVREIFSSSQTITTRAGDGIDGYSGDGGAPKLAELGVVPYAQTDVKGDLYILDGNNAIREVATGSNLIETVAGNGQQEGVDANLVQLSSPIALAEASNGDLLISDAEGYRIRRVSTKTHQISTFAGIGVTYTSGDGGPATAAGIGVPLSMAWAPDGTMYFDGETSFSIRSIDSAGNITTVAGNGTFSYSGNNGPALSAGLSLPFGICYSGGALYESEVFSNTIRRIDLTTMQISLYAGIPNTSGFGNGAALSASFNSPYTIAADAAGNIYVADGGNNAIRKISSGASPVVSTICGLGPTQGGYRGDGGPASKAAVDFPVGLFIDSSGDIYFGDGDNSRVRRIDGVTGIISTVAGSGLQGYAGDGGPALEAELNEPVGVVLDSQKNLLIADYSNNVIRKVSYVQTPQPTPVVSNSGIAAAYPSPASDRICFSYVAPQSGSVTISIYNMGFQLAAQIQDQVTAGHALTCGSVLNLAPGVYIYRISAPGTSISPNKFKVVR